MEHVEESSLVVAPGPCDPEVGSVHVVEGVLTQHNEYHLNTVYYQGMQLAAEHTEEDWVPPKAEPGQKLLPAAFPSDRTDRDVHVVTAGMWCGCRQLYPRSEIDAQHPGTEFGYGTGDRHVVCTSPGGAVVLRVTPLMVQRALIEVSSKAEAVLGCAPGARDEPSLAYLEEHLFEHVYTRSPIHHLKGKSQYPPMIREIVSKMFLSTIGAGAFAAEEGRRIKAVHILLRGTIMASKAGSDTEHPLSCGDSFGEAALDLVFQGKYGYTMVAETEVALASIDIAHLKAIIGSNIDVVPSMLMLPSPLRSDEEARIACDILTRRLQKKALLRHPLWDGLCGAILTPL